MTFQSGCRTPCQLARHTMSRRALTPSKLAQIFLNSQVITSDINMPPRYCCRARVACNSLPAPFLARGRSHQPLQAVSGEPHPHQSLLSIITGETNLAQRKARLLGGNPLYPASTCVL